MNNLKLDMPDTQAKTMLNVLKIQDLDVNKVKAMRNYAFRLRKKFPHMKPARLQRKVAEEFHVKLI